MLGEFEQSVLEKKYLQEGETCWTDVCSRVAREIEKVKPHVAADLYDLMIGRYYSPAGSVLANIGSDPPLSLSNCYFIDISEDSIEGIFDFMKHAARTFSYRGGVGTDISILRPKGAPVRNAAKYSSGSVSFLPLISTMILSIGQGSDEEGNIVARRGAGIASQIVSHPDIINFIKCKSNPVEVFGEDIFRAVPNDVSGLNLSVKITDEFMKAVEEDADWDLVYDGKVYSTVNARWLFNLICEHAWASGDPGILFLDNALKWTTLDINDTSIPAGVNPCVTGDTLIQLKGGTKPIAELVNTPVEIWNGYEWSVVTPRVTGHNQQLLKIKFSNGIYLTCTKYHKFVLKNGVRITAQNLNVGDVLYTWFNIYGNVHDNVQVVSIKDAGVAETVYCFEEPLRHTGVFNGIMTGQCGEQWLPKMGNCNLASFNLLAYSTNTGFNWSKFEKDVAIAAEVGDAIIDLNKHPLRAQAEQDKYLRKIGIGITGLGDSLALQALKYSSDKARAFALKIMKTITLNGFETSVKMAEKHGCAPILESEENRVRFVNQPFVERFDKELKKAIIEKGLRNTAMTSIAPTGSLSIILGNLTSGCEPLFAVEYERKSRTTGKTHTITHPPIIEYNIDPSNYEVASELHYKDRIAMQAALQEWTTDSISSTINLPASTTVDEIKDIYMTAWKAGLKGITIYRDSSKDAQVLSTSKKEDVVCMERPADITYKCAPKRPYELDCNIHIATIKGEKYVVIVSLFNDKPYEVFCGKADILYIPTTVKTGKVIKNGKGKYSLVIRIRGVETEYKDIAKSLMDEKEQGMTRLISLALRHGVFPKFIVEQLRKTSGSIVDFSTVVARVLAKYAKDLTTVEKCPECGSTNLRIDSGCPVCIDCGYSKCG